MVSPRKVVFHLRVFCWFPASSPHLFAWSPHRHMKFLIGTKQGMTQVFDKEGRAYPVTVISASPVTVTQVKTTEKDGYQAVQIGYGIQKESRVYKAQRPKGNFKGFKEFPVTEGAEFTVGTKIGADIFGEGDMVSVSAISKGKGF